MVFHPVLPVYPHGIIYRAFSFEPYRTVSSHSAAMIIASAAAFAFSRIIFCSPGPVGLTFVVGLLLAWGYYATDSLLVPSLEHALYGCFMFIVGLGGLFHHGAARVPVSR